jgi:hypothetical protein
VDVYFGADIVAKVANGAAANIVSVGRHVSKVPGAEIAQLERFDQTSPVGTIAAVSTIKITLLSGARVQCNTPFGTVKP